MKNYSKEFVSYSMDILDKAKAVDNDIAYMLNRTQSMFHYENLPAELPQTYLELYLQTNGNVFFTKHNDKFYCFKGSAGGELDEYYRPTKYIVSNPYLNLYKEYDIDVDGVLIRNDTLEQGLLPLFKKYCVLMAENNVSIRQAVINSRAISIISASDDRTKASADLFLKKLTDGELTAIGEVPFFDGIKAFNTNQSQSVLTHLIETQQYLKASMFNEIGLDANYNMKRERISSTEAELNDDFLLPLVDNMIECRRKGIEKVNEMFDLDISVDFASTWLTNELENEKEQNIYQSVELESTDHVSENVEEIIKDISENDTYVESIEGGENENETDSIQPRIQLDEIAT